MSKQLRDRVKETVQGILDRTADQMHVSRAEEITAALIDTGWLTAAATLQAMLSSATSGDSDARRELREDILARMGTSIEAANTIGTAKDRENVQMVQRLEAFATQAVTAERDRLEKLEAEHRAQQAEEAYEFGVSETVIAAADVLGKSGASKMLWMVRVLRKVGSYDPDFGYDPDEDYS